ncbi:hypothetical protein GCM10008959_25510 [Deinococcus seoulensis]|uniref:Uncharacterized protein n=1 Tax=Deinococcus seoulensis TaxID=1837379 RepID=A0ABQ2RT86_9DEIO|nr:hypothetical protein [Deinococcus seoulensis]GGR62429.1 hypothetical protein GCM10008959_25510 [Deinococcus seoulensis]
MTPDPSLLEAVLLAALESPCGITGALARSRTLTPAPLPALDRDETVRCALARYVREHWIQVLPGAAPRYHLTGLGEQRLLWHRQRGTLEAPA